MFIWCLSHNSLSTRMNVKRKGVELDTRYPMCNRADEDGGHLFLKCKQVKSVWHNLQVEDIRCSLLSAPDALSVFEMVEALPSPKRELVLILMWDWWTARNKKNAEGKECISGSICHRIQRHAIEFCTFYWEHPLGIC